MNFLKKEVVIKKTYLRIILEGFGEAIVLAVAFYILLTNPTIKEAVEIAQKVDTTKLILIVFPILLVVSLCIGIARALMFGQPTSSKKKK